MGLVEKAQAWLLLELWHSIPTPSTNKHTHIFDLATPILSTPVLPPTKQALLSHWEEKVARQLEFISELQSPTARHSMMAVSAASAARGGDNNATGMRASRMSSFSAPFVSSTAAGAGAAAPSLAGSVSGEMVGGPQAVGPGRSSVAFSREAAASTGFGSSFSSASFAAGLLGGAGGAGGGNGNGVGGDHLSTASAPNSPQLWGKSGGSSTPPGTGLGGAGMAPRRSAFTPGPALTGMGDASPGGGI